MRRAARVYVALVLVVLVLASGVGTERSRAFLGLDPAAWIVVGQMASVVSNLTAMRDTMVRIRDEALSAYRGLVEPIDDFAGQMRLALGTGASIDLSAIGGADPRDFVLPACAALPPANVGTTPCIPDAFPAVGNAYADLPGIDPDVTISLEALHGIRAADFELQIAEADHRDRLVEEALVAIALYHGCEPARADADRRGVIVCPNSRTWTPAEREGLRQRLADSVSGLSSTDCPATAAGGLGQGVCPSSAQHRSLLLAATQAEADLNAVLLKLDAEDADRERRALERELVEEGRRERGRLDRLEQLAALDLSLGTATGRANVLAAELHAQNPAAPPLGGRLFVPAY